MTHLKNFINDIRNFMYGGMITLPATIAGTMMILGLFTANYAMLFFLLGFLIVTPVTSYILNDILFEFFGSWIEMSILYASSLFQTKDKNGESVKTKMINHFKKPIADICGFKVPYKTSLNEIETEEKPITSSIWVAMISFFIGYIFTNGIELYNKNSPDVLPVDTDSNINFKVNNRKYQAIISMISIIIFGIIALVYRMYTSCESKLSIVLSSPIFIWLGYGWYKLLSTPGDRLSDLFGIANRLLSPNAILNEPIACIPHTG